MNIDTKRFVSADDSWDVLGVYPDGEARGVFKTAMVIILSEETGEDALRRWMEYFALEPYINGEREKMTVIFPQCRDGHWNVGEGDTLSPDEKMLEALLGMSGGAPGGWRSLIDVQHLIGIGSGADLVTALAAKRPSHGCAASVTAIGGTGAGLRPLQAPVPAWLVDMPGEVAEAFCRGNLVDDREGTTFLRACNPAHCVRVETAAEFRPETWWSGFALRLRRITSSAQGDAVPRSYRVPGHAIFHEDELLSDGLRHNWMEILPPSLRVGKTDPVPLMLVSHGAGGNPVDTCECFGMHEVGEAEGFITVYVHSCNRRSWNLNLYPDQGDDVGYYLALIEDLKARYPIDATRIYTTGFSNGAGMAMLFALMHPEIVAASCPVDSTFPYATMKFFHPAHPEPYLVEEGAASGHGPMPSMDPETALRPLQAALAAQQARETPLKLPVMYFYGTRENEYPIRAGSNQELNYRFWKDFNGIPQAQTDDSLQGDEAVGVLGDEIRTLTPWAVQPEHTFYDHVFFTPEGLDAYHLVLMRGKAHDVHPYESRMGWDFVSRFARQADGSLSIRD